MGPFLLLAASSVWAQGAVVQNLVGEAQYGRQGTVAAVTVSQRLLEGDTVITPEGGSLILRFDDQSVLLVRERSRVKLQSLRMRGPVSKQNQVFQVTVGGLRYITGLIGKRRPSAIRFLTPTATVGIRGTDLDLVVRDVADVDILPGTYVQVNTGAVQMRAIQENLVLEANEAAFVGDPVVTRSGRRIPTTKRLTQGAPGSDVFSRSALDDQLSR
jgi:OmpA-OmpF porin, OOP family